MRTGGIYESVVRWYVYERPRVLLLDTRRKKQGTLALLYFVHEAERKQGYFSEA